MQKSEIAALLQKKGYVVEENSLLIIGEKDNYRVTLSFRDKECLVAVMVEVKDTSTSVRLQARADRGVTLTAEEKEGNLLFVRKDAISSTEMVI